MKRAVATAAITTAMCLACAATALAHVIVKSVPGQVQTCMKLGVRYKSSSGGPRGVQVKVVRAGASHPFWLDKTQASKYEWKTWWVCPPEGSYVVTYKTGNGTFTYHTQVTD